MATAVGVLVPAAAAGTTEAAGPPPSVEAPLAPDVAARQFSEDTGIPFADAAAAFENSTAISDFVATFWASDSVGGVWVTYDGGYQVHLRQTDDQAGRAAKDLQSKITEPLKLHFGGASLGDLNGAAEYIHKHLPTMPYNLNVQEGYVDVLEPVELPDSVIDPRWIRVVDQLPVAGGKPLVNHAGLAWKWWFMDANVYTDHCTVGFTWMVPGTWEQGTATAAHCLDGTYRSEDAGGTVYGNTFGVGNVYENCAVGDIQYQWTAGGVGYAAYLWNTWGTVHAIAGGYYIGQPSITSGSTTGQLWDEVLGFGNYVRDGSALTDCPSDGTVHGLWVGNNNQTGDSGGPIFLWYETKLHLAGTISFGSLGNWSVGAWTNWVARPAGSVICTVTTPC